MKIITLIIALFLSSQIKSENQEFIEFIGSFDNSQHSIDFEFAKRYFDFTPNPDESKIYTGRIIYNRDSLISFTCIIPCTAGGYCERTDYYVFNLEGKQLNKIRNLEFNFTDCGSSDYKSCIYYSDTLLIIQKVSEKTDCGNDSTISINLKIDYFQVANDADLIPLKSDYINTKREYYFASSEFIDAEKIDQYSVEALSRIRNEIFAAHGYKFKSSKWQEYFSEKDWYKPKFENVDEFLTFIEKENIKIIVALEKNKNAR